MPHWGGARMAPFHSMRRRPRPDRAKRCWRWCERSCKAKTQGASSTSSASISRLQLWSSCMDSGPTALDSSQTDSTCSLTALLSCLASMQHWSASGSLTSCSPMGMCGCAYAYHCAHTCRTLTWLVRVYSTYVPTACFCTVCCVTCV